MARGETFLGRNTEGGRVSYLALEEMRAEVRGHFERIGGTFEDVGTWFGAFNGQSLATLAATIQEHRPILAVVDPLIRLARFKDTNDYSDVSSVLEPFAHLARDSGCHIMFVHHLGKKAGGGTDAILGSTAIFASVDTALLMQETASGRVLESTQRYGTPLPKTWLDFDPATGRIDLGEASAAALSDEVEGRVLKLLAEVWMTEQALWRELGGNNAVNARVLRKLVDNRILFKKGEGRKGSPYRYSCLEE